MRLAIAFDDLIQFGGAERLLLAVCEIWPDAPVYTSLASLEWEKRCADKGIRLHTSFMQKLPFKKRLNRFYSVLGFHMLAFESFDFSDFDVVLSISARYAHAIITKPSTKHICYMNSPSRQFWDSASYFARENFLVRGLSLFLAPFLWHARQWDYTMAQRVDHFLANSKVPQARIRRFYGRTSEIIYPPVEIPELLPISSDSPQDFYLVLTRLVSWKRVDIAIEAAKKLGFRLKIVGGGPARKKLESLARGYANIEFLGYVSSAEKWQLLADCNALIMTQEEDFGITAVEALAAGSPVIAYGKGGALTTIISGKTGEFFAPQDCAALSTVIKKIKPSKYVSSYCRKEAQKFARTRFQKDLEKKVNEVYLNLL